jgi:hypothetical protein
MLRVRKMSEQFSILVPNLELNPFDFLPLLLMPPPAVTTTTTKIMIPREINGRSILDGHKVSSDVNRSNPRMPLLLFLYSANGTEPYRPPCRLSPCPTMDGMSAVTVRSAV